MKNKILIVDDAEINRSLLADILSVEYDIMEASNGVEADLPAESVPRRVLSPLILLETSRRPEMDRFEVLAIINEKRIDSEHSGRVATSAETSSSYIEHAYDLGAAESHQPPI